METKTFHFDKKDLITLRSSTGGFQPKFLSRDRQYFVKAQAVISGVTMQDWLVEIIASDFCRQLDIIRKNAVEKLYWCAKQLSLLCGLEYMDCLNYMLDTAVIDCLVGNVDRHTRNFGIFYNNLCGKYEIPLIFDSGMGLFENDSYRDHYKTFEDAMHNCYVSPYGGDPFDLIDILEKEFAISKRYSFQNLRIIQALPGKYAIEYTDRMLRKVKNLA